MAMILVEGTFNHGDGQQTRFLINNDGSWQQWGGSAEQMGKTVEYVTSMAQGLTETDYFRQDAPETAETPEMGLEPTATDDSPADGHTDAPLEGVALDPEPATYKSFGDLALWYSMKVYGKGTAELDKAERKSVKRAVKTMVREDPDLLPAAERERYGI